MFVLIAVAQGRVPGCSTEVQTWNLFCDRQACLLLTS
jgi:hypothetical protein